mmetsp:Transcript_7299/g.10771  ORF Transcript_7299/g.10771 Transcript_7299/m.10771 type:complete len:228 (-) Transcript_7299:2013-2696(-)
MDDATSPLISVYASKSGYNNDDSCCRSFQSKKCLVPYHIEEMPSVWISMCSSVRGFARDFDGAAAEFDVAEKMSRKVPSCYRIHIPEATGYNLHTIGHACFTANLCLFTVALLDIAKAVAGCDDNLMPNNNAGDDAIYSMLLLDIECDLKVWGLRKPSSLMGILGTIFSVGSFILLLVIGALIDHTPHRRRVARWLCCVSEAYLPDMNMDDRGMSSYATKINFIFYA